MKKNLFAVLIAVIIFIGCLPTSFAAGTITINELKFENGKIYVSANVDAVGRNYSMIVVRKGGDPSDLNDRYGMREETSGADKIVNFVFKMPEKRESLKSETNPEGYTDGEYTITVKGLNTNKAEKDFTFVTEGMKTTVADMIIKSSESALYTYLEKNSPYRNTLINMGFDFSEYDMQSLSVKEKIVSEFAEKIPYYGNKLSEAFANSVKLLLVSKDAEAVVTQLEDGGYEFEGKKFTDLDEYRKDWIVSAYLEHGSFDDLDEFEKMYEIINILYIINTSRFDEVESFMAMYADTLGIAEASEYKQYKELDVSDRQATNEKFVAALSRSSAKDVKNLLSVLSASKTKASSGSGKNYKDKVDTGFTAFPGGTVGEITATETKDVFSDIGSVTWAKDAIKYLYDRKMIAGVGDGKFDPDGMITREQFATLIVNALGLYNPTAVTDFTDVEAGSWYEKNVASAQENGIITGMDEETFGVGRNITRQDVAVIIARCAAHMGLQLENNSGEEFADDLLISEYAKESVYTLVTAGIINGMDDNKFVPDGNCTRAQAARLVYLLLTYVDADYEQKVPADIISKFNFLSGLGMFSGATSDMINMEAPMLKGKFIQNAMRLVCGEEIPDSQLLEHAKMYGIGSAADYDYDSKISFDEAFSIVLQLSTFEMNNNINESAVQSYKSAVVRGTTESGTEPVSQGSVINLLYNAAKFEGIMTLSGSGYRESYSVANNTILEAKRNITRVIGIVTDNELTSLNGTSTVGEGEVKIDSVVALEGRSGAGQYLGKRVEAYIYFGEDENKVIYVEDKGKTPELIISAEKLSEVSMTNRTIIYEVGDKLKTAKYSPVVKFIRNGRYYPGYKKEDIEITNGSLRLVDNDGDNVFDIIFAEQYTHIVVNGVLPHRFVVKNKYQTPSEFDFSEYDKYSIIYNGEKTDFSQISQGDILTVLATGQGEDEFATAYVTRKKVTGKVTGLISETDEVIIDGATYRLSDAYKNAGKESDAEYSEINIAATYDFYLDYFGKVVYVQKSESADEYSYVYASKVYEETDSATDTYYLKYFTLDSEWEKKAFADKLLYNGKSTKSEVVFNNISKIGPDVFKIRINDEDRISAIETAEATYDPDVFNKVSAKGQWSINTFSLVDQTSGGGLLMLFDDSTKLFLVPESGDEREYSIGNKRRFVADQKCTITAYGLDEFKVADVAVFSKDTSVASSSPIFLVADIKNTVVNDEAAIVLEGSSDEKNEYTAVPGKGELFEGVQKGDLIAYNTNEIDEVQAFVKLWSLDDYGKKMTPKQWNSTNLVYDDSEFNKGTVFASGFVKSIDYKGMKMLVDTGSPEAQVFNGKNDVVIPKVLIYDRTEKKTELTTMDSIIPGDFVFMRFSWTRLQTVYIIR